METVYQTGSVDSIVSKVVSELSECIFIIYYADDRRFEEISSKLHKEMPSVKMIGTTGYMFHKTGSYEEGIAAIGFTMEEIEVYVGTLRKIDTCPIRYLPGLIWSVNTINEKYDNHICIEFTTGHEEKLVSTMKVSLETAGMRLVGGTAGNTAQGAEKKVACNGKVLTNSAVYAVIGSKMGRIDVYKENLFHARKTTHMVTKVSEDCRTIIEIDGRKAMDVYEEELGYTKSDVNDGIFKNPLSRIVGSENYITAIFSFNPDRSITTYKNIQKNDMICFTDIDADYRNYIRENMNNVCRESNIAGIVSINCILRYMFFKNDNYISEYASLLSSKARGRHLGMVSDGEQYIEQHVNQSMVCAIFTKDR